MQDFHFLLGNTVGYLTCSPLRSEGLFSIVTKLANRSHQWKGQKWWLDGSGGVQTLVYLLRGAGTGWLPVVPWSSHDCPAYDPSSGHLLTIPPHPWLVPTYVCPTPYDQDSQGVGNLDLFSPQSIILFLTLCLTPLRPSAFILTTCFIGQAD